MRLIAIIFVIFSTLNATLYEPIDANRDRGVLLALDVHEAFLQDSEFQNMKGNFAFYRQEVFLRILSDAYIYQPLIKQKFADAGLPPELIYMAMAESSFRPSAYSSARAVGIWQFINGTARKYGLRVDDYIDERRDPIKSTDAAIRYLKDLHAEFGKWSLAIMAYNCGEGRMRSAIRKAGTDNLAVLMSVDISKGKRNQFLPRETREYLRKVLVMAALAESESLMVSSNSEHLLNRGSSYPMAVVDVAGGALLQDIARSAGVSVSALKQMNPALRYEFTPPYGRNYALYIPYDKVAAFKQNYSFTAPSTNSYSAYIVQRGDTLGAIAMRHGVSIQSVKDFNSIKGTSIRPGQKLVIPMFASRAVQAQNKQAQSKASETGKSGKSGYIVRRGDSLDSIARKFKVSVAELKDINQLRTSRIYAGNRLIIHP
ncbi:lytic transglycosylase [Campylobacterota bacterium]|nr:lytic transglycosylase [Campylobacterota bacterium]